MKNRWLIFFCLLLNSNLAPCFGVDSPAWLMGIIRGDDQAAGNQFGAMVKRGARGTKPLMMELFTETLESIRHNCDGPESEKITVFRGLSLRLSFFGCSTITRFGPAAR